MPLDVVLTVLRIALAILFVGMGVAHFVPGVARGMGAMIPPFLKRPGWPSTRFWVVFTGLCELAGGIGLLIPGIRVAAAVALAVFLVAVFPANAYAARHPERFGKAATPLVPRLLAQIALIALVLVAGLAA